MVSAQPGNNGHSPLQVKGVAAVDGSHIPRVVEEVGAVGAQSTDRHDYWTQRAQVAKETATNLVSWPPPTTRLCSLQIWLHSVG